MTDFAILAPLGFAIGAFGTLVGAGGGSLLVPALLLLMPNESAATLTSISLAVVFLNAYSGTVAYMRMGRIDYYAGVLFTLSGAPGAILGAALVHQLPRALFDPFFGFLLLAMGVFLAANPLGRAVPEEGESPGEQSNLLVGSIGSAYIAVVASMLGIGGGIIHVPFLIRVLRMPPHTATATSHFVLTFLAFIATVVHVALGEFTQGIDRAAYLGIGVMMGAPLGAALSVTIRGSMIVRLLAASLCLAGLRLVGRMF